MRGYDRNDVLRQTDLRALADEVLAPRKGVGNSGTWPCPFPTHGPQSGKTPPVTIFDGRDSIQRWRCHPCGRGGTAIDLVELTQGLQFKDALDFLGRRIGAPETERSTRQPQAPAQRPLAQEIPRGPQAAPAAVADYVKACEARLWSEKGKPVRDWLHQRGLDEKVLRLNHVGADPGPSVLPRAKGLPYRGQAVVFPVFHGSTLTYLQVRYLGHDDRRYENPSAKLFAHSPKVAEVRPVTKADPSPNSRVLICEGVPDALSAAQAGERTLAILGAGYPDAAIANDIVQRFPSERIVIAFDSDDAGRSGAGRLYALLGERGAERRTGCLLVPETHGDLNGWLKSSGHDRFESELRSEITGASDIKRLFQVTPASGQPLSPSLVPGS